MTTRQELLEEARRIVSIDRAATHGGAELSFETIAKYWRTYLQSRLGVDAGALNAADVTAMMGLLKIARMGNSQQHEDHWVDLIGYAACGGELAISSDNDSLPALNESTAPTAPPTAPPPAPSLPLTGSATPRIPKLGPFARVWIALIGFCEAALTGGADLIHKLRRSRLITIILGGIP